jgi:hypothetical protein
MSIQDKFNQFFTKWNGKFLESYDSSNLNQCYDLVTEWSKTIGLAPPMTLYAYQIYVSHPDTYTTIPNTPTGVPECGDIIVWGKDFNGGAGHTGVATGKGDINNFECFVQNDPLGSSCHLKTYNYNNVTGWLRPKIENTDTPSNPSTPSGGNSDALNSCLTAHKEAVTSANRKDEQIKTIYLGLPDIDKSITDTNKQVEIIIDKLLKLNSAIISSQQSNVILAEDLKKCQALPNLAVQCQSNLDALQKRYDKLKSTPSKAILSLLIAIADKLGVKI